MRERPVHLGDAFFTDPHALYRELRDRGGVHPVVSEHNLTGWMITDYEAAREALADPRLSKSAERANALLARQGDREPQVGGRLTSNMLAADPPDHTRLRRLVNKAFTVRAVEAMRPRLEEVTARLLDELSGDAETDLVAAFAEPLPITVICELLGVPFSDRSGFREWTATLLSTAPQADRAHAARSMADYLTALVQDKRAHPAEDMLSALVRARDEDDRLSEPELTSMAFLLLVAGHETTVNLIANGTLALLRAPDQFELLRATPSLVPSAIEEFLRYDGPVNLATLRYTAEPVTIEDVEIPPDTFVHVALPAANRDPARFPDPDRLDVTRDAGGHLAFGHGIHFCVGARLARLEAEIAFRHLLDRFPGLRLARPDEGLPWRPSFRIRSLDALPVRLK
ncbi:cytochrome P450 family protein [Actinomadura kijaniata]|uniref:cytochrome P450 family protein n=1 Tax=Actinomadura kijaniata TaxID=46161 RepID=UPI000830108E|nr:cytochrome P450 [Actinomadura kijaniata]